MHCTLAAYAQRLAFAGTVALWRGSGVGLLRDSCYASTFFSCVAIYGDSLERTGSKTRPILHLLTASAAGATATVCTYPLDVVRTRLAAGPQHATHGYVIWQLVRMEGVVSHARPGLSALVTS